MVRVRVRRYALSRDLRPPAALGHGLEGGLVVARLELPVLRGEARKRHWLR